ncbi:LysR family transcriptional regulator [uncultured Brevundimonas sp.]|uniref:LysR family transcriptional regulator n=1 Tax=uncultured Brevundimonas sp. TaxID=213418 RepID=UPI0025EA2751|nr:LysR family transcriptional regulator [uncultured Brevundimonas sp.]
MIERYLLRYFMAVVDTGGFSRAAAACQVSQPTLSIGIAKLERLVGAPLLNRSNRRIEVTEAGARLIDHARRIEAAFAAAETVGHQADPRPLIRLGVLSSLPGRWLETAIRQTRASAPDERLEIREGSQKELLSLLTRGRIDAALAIVTPAARAYRLLFSEGYAMALPRDHPFGGESSVRAEDLAADTMIVRRHCEALADTSRHFTQRGVRPFMAARTTSDDRALAFVRSGLGVTLMPECFASDGVAMPALSGFQLQRQIAVLVQPDSTARIERTKAFEVFGSVYASSGAHA